MPRVPERRLQRRPNLRRHFRALPSLLQKQREHRRRKDEERRPRRRVLCDLAREVPPRRGDGPPHRAQTAPRHAARGRFPHEKQAYTQSNPLPGRHQPDLAHHSQASN